MRTAVISVLMDLPADHQFHRATLAALDHAAAAGGVELSTRVIPTDSIGDPARVATESSAVLIGPGSPYREPNVALAVVREARDRQVPLVGT